ncbi:hypothetical protein GCM10027280_52980 [Micromonospora polyrhachis]
MANGLPRKISVLLLKEARNVHSSGAITRMAHTRRAMCPRPERSRTSDFCVAAECRRSLPARLPSPVGCPPSPVGRAVDFAGPAGAIGLLFVVISGPAQSSIVSRLLTRRVSAANVIVRKNNATPIAEA